MKVAIQGVLASFHDLAAKKYFGKMPFSSIECLSFKGLCQSLESHETDVGVMAIENTIAGSILTNYAFLEQYQFKIVGEVYLRIELCLMALPRQSLEEIKFVQSHPMALYQSQEFLYKYPAMKVLETSDTAESAKNIGMNKLKNYAAIAAFDAAEQYGLEILSHGIETNKQNYTRFLVIQRHEDYTGIPGANKASIRFETADKPGSLHAVLGILKEHDINMTKIQSVPVLGKPYQYSIHVDLEWKNQEAYHAAMKDIEAKTEKLFRFGEYKRGDRPHL